MTIEEKYRKLFPIEMTWKEISEKLKSMENDEDIIYLREVFCNVLIYAITTGYLEYAKDFDIRKIECGRLLLENVQKLPRDEAFYWMVYSFYIKDYDSCVKYFDHNVEMQKANLRENKFKEDDIVEFYIDPMKNAFPGFWNHAQEKLKDLCMNDGTQDLCALMDRVYNRESDEEGIDSLSSFIQKFPKIIIAKEYIACFYYDQKKWNNAIAWFESIERPMLFANAPEQLHMLLGNAYGKIKDFVNEEASYRTALSTNPETLYANNNLAYCLYKQKKYLEAKKILEKCIENGWDMPYAANNYVRVLIALGRNKDAKQFANKTPYKIIKALREKVKNLSDTNRRLKKVEDFIEIAEEDAEVIPETTAFEVKGKQFSTEKILEDELTARIESGIPVFGKKLKVYKRKGQYGRQFIIPIGRLDLLCEDENGDLYIIELKKDSGYDDVYAQISGYLDWFAQDKMSDGKKVFGIICLNNPSPELIEKVHKDERLKIFEYQISYTEK